MITINLLPEELRIKEKINVNVPLFKILAAIGSLLAVLTVFFYVDFLISSGKLHSMDNEWSRNKPEFQELTGLTNEIDGPLKHEKDFMERFVTTTRPLTHILMWLSEYLPETSWLTEVQLSRQEDRVNLVIRGLAFSTKEKSSIEQIESYLQNLKTKMPEASLSLTTSRQEFEGVMLTQFSASYQWTNREELLL